MQRHVPYDKQMVTYHKARREYESVSEERGLSNTGGSDAERENSESLPGTCVLGGLFISLWLSAVSVTLCVHSCHVREVIIASINDGVFFSSIPQNCAGKERKALSRF